MANHLLSFPRTSDLHLPWLICIATNSFIYHYKLDTLYNSFLNLILKSKGYLKLGMLNGIIQFFLVLLPYKKFNHPIWCISIYNIILEFYALNKKNPLLKYYNPTKQNYGSNILLSYDPYPINYVS